MQIINNMESDKKKITISTAYKGYLIVDFDKNVILLILMYRFFIFTNGKLKFKVE